MSDKVDDAVAAVFPSSATAPEPAPTLRVSVTLSSTQRAFAVEIPSDMTEAELIEASAWMLSTLANHLAAERAKSASSRIFLPFGRS